MSNKEREPFKKTDWRWTYEAAGMLGWSIPQLMAATLPEIRYALSGALRIHGFDPDKVFGTSGMSRKALDTLMDAFPDSPPDNLHGVSSDMPPDDPLSETTTQNFEKEGGKSSLAAMPQKAPSGEHCSADGQAGAPISSQNQASKPSYVSRHDHAFGLGHSDLQAYMRRRPFE